MADQGADLPYAEMVRRQGAEDIARLRAHWARPMWEISATGGGDEKGRWLVWQLVGVFDDAQRALVACASLSNSAAAILDPSMTPAEF